MNLFFKRNLSLLYNTTQKLSEINLVRRDYVSPKNLASIELKSLLWTALDLKKLFKQNNLNVPAVKGVRITLLLDNSSVKTQLPINAASKLLNTSTNIVADSEWKNDNLFISEFGRLLATSSDMIFCQVHQQKIIEQIADGANVPVININSSSFNLIKTLSDIMTIYLHFNRLKYLTMAWIGKSESLFNTYLYVLPQLKMNLKYCLVETETSNVFVEEARRYSQKFNTEIHELWDVKQTVYRSDIIATSAHSNQDFQVTMDDIKEAALKWAFLHELPRGEFDVQREVFMHTNSLVWKSVENLQWIYAAMIIRFLSGYTHVSAEPNFDADEFPSASELPVKRT